MAFKFGDVVLIFHRNGYFSTLGTIVNSTGAGFYDVEEAFTGKIRNSVAEDKLRPATPDNLQALHDKVEFHKRRREYHTMRIKRIEETIAYLKKQG